MSNMNHEAVNLQALVAENAAPGNRRVHELGGSQPGADGQDGEVRQPRTALSIAPGVAARPIGRAGIIGANAIGVGIAMDLLEAGVPVTLFELERTTLDAVIARVRAAYGHSVAKGELAPEARDRRMALLAGTINFHHLKDADLIVDTVPAAMPAREQMFRRLDQTARRGAVLTTARALDGVDRLAACTRRQGEVLGLRLPDPADTEQVWELVPGRGTSEASLATVIALARQLHKTAALGAANAMCPAAQGEAAAAWQVDQIQE